MILHFSHRSFVRFVSLSVFIIVSKGKLNVNKAGIPSVHTHCFPLRPSGALRQNHRRQKKAQEVYIGFTRLRYPQHIRGIAASRPQRDTARVGRNPKTGEEIPISEARLPVFKAGKALKDAVAK